MDMKLYHQWLSILDHLNIGVFLVDSNRRIRQFNTSGKIIVGLEDDEIMGGDCQEIFCGIPCFSTCPFHEKESADIRDMDIEFLDEAQDRHRVTRVGAPLLDVDGNVKGCVSVLQDHAPYSELVNRIHYEEQSLKIILDSLNMGIFTVNRNGLITFFNHTAEKISGYNRMKLLGRESCTLFGHRDKKGKGMIRQAIKKGVPVSGIKGTLVNSEDEKIPVTVDYIPLVNNLNKVIGGLTAIQDMTLVHQLDQVKRHKYDFHHMIGKAPVMQKLFDMVKVVAGTESTILIQGPTGTGKDLMAKIIHSRSRRAEKPFIKVNCAAIPENLLESEIFGYVKGAFTGADRDKPGRFSQAHTGTIFLDEIGDLPLPLQAKLLRVLEDREFYPLGSRKTQKVDIRILSATNRRLEHLVAEKKFREDLFYRLNVLRLDLPPLCHRQGDLPLLIRHILRKQSAAMEKPVPDICETAMQFLLNYPYPGNVRELENILEHSLIICQNDIIRSEHLPAYLLGEPTKSLPLQSPPSKSLQPSKNLQKTIEPDISSQRDALIKTLNKYNWHRGLTAQALNIDRSTLWRKMKKFQLISSS